MIPDISGKQYVVLAVIAQQCESRPTTSIREVAEAIGVSKTLIHNHVKHLREIGLLAECDDPQRHILRPAPGLSFIPASSF